MRCPYCSAENIAGIELCENCGADLAGLDIPEARGGAVGQLITDAIADIDLTPPFAVTADETVEEVILKMREARHGCVQIVEDGQLTGIFSERDVLGRVLRPGRDPAATLVREVMTVQPRTQSVGDPPAHAIHRMVSQRFRHLPITRGGKLVGSISVRNILRYIDRAILGAEPAE